jgi:hypothetical protein
MFPHKNNNFIVVRGLSVRADSDLVFVDAGAERV